MDFCGLQPSSSGLRKSSLEKCNLVTYSNCQECSHGNKLYTFLTITTLTCVIALAPLFIESN